MSHQRTALDEVSLVRLHHGSHQCSLFLPASIKMWVRSSTSGIKRDGSFDVAFFVQPIAQLQQFIVDPQQLLEGIGVDHHEWNSIKRPYLQRRLANGAKA